MKPAQPREEGDRLPPWQTIYCSLIMIMLVLFVMLSAYSTADRTKMKGLQSNLSGARSEKGKAAGEEEAVTGPLRQEGLPGAEWIRDARRSLAAAGRKSGLAGDVIMETTPRGLKLKFKSDVLFRTGQAAIAGEAYPYLDEMIRVAGEKNLSLRIEGHTDDVPVQNGAFPSNWELSTARATTVLRYFNERGKIDAGRLTAAGFGQHRSLAPNDTPEGRARNRRIEVLLVQDHNAGPRDDKGGQVR